jgi:hypothetical protein
VKKLVLVGLVAAAAALGLRMARSGPSTEADLWSQATDTVPR